MSLNSNYHYEYKVEFGDTFFDPKTTCSIEIHSISLNNTVNIQLTRPEMPSVFLQKVKIDTFWVFNYDGKEYQLTINNVAHESRYIEVAVIELAN